jgi:hypothetical protein
MTTFTFNSRRSPVYGRNGMVATSQPLATAAGLEILSKGGNAADAAVAAGAALNVTEPTSTGIGGDMFALYYSAETKRVTALNGSGRAPAALTLDRLKEDGFSSDLPPFHAHTITVPGACAGWFDLVERHGSLSMGEILAPAIRLAMEWLSCRAGHSQFLEVGRAGPVEGGLERTRAHHRRPGAAGRRDLPQPEPCPNLRDHRTGWPGCLLPGRDRPGHRRRDP